MWEQIACRTAAKQIVPEVSSSQLDHLVTYQRALAPPNSQSRNELGRLLFAKTGCEACHTPTWKLPIDIWPEFLADQEVAPYTDLLLHDMGPGLSDGLFQGDAILLNGVLPLFGGFLIVAHYAYYMTVVRVPSKKRSCGTTEKGAKAESFFGH